MILPMNLVEAASLSRDTVPGPNAWSVPFVVIVEGKVRTCVNNQKEAHG